MTTPAPPGQRRTIAVAQLGARMHYAVPRILHGAGLLERFYTDFCAQTLGLDRAAWLIPEALKRGGMRRALDRKVEGVPRDKVTTFPAVGLIYGARLRLASRPDHHWRAHAWAARAFARAIIRSGLGQAGGIYGFNGASLELFDHARRHSLATILEQTMAPLSLEHAILREERLAWEGWEVARRDDFARELSDREVGEWQRADVIVCGSEFVREGIGLAGGPTERCVVVPYGVDAPPASEAHRRGPVLRALFVGALGLRKGIQYLLEAMDLLGPGIAECRVVGPTQHLTPRALEQLARRLTIVGPRPRSAVREEYARADVLVLPTLFEGSATVCYEAMAAGLPVITTPNAGSVVRDGVEGFVVPVRDPKAIAEALRRLAADRERCIEMGRAGALRARDFTVARYGERLLEAVTGERGDRRAPPG